jgi:hypothetical protein
MCKVTLDEHYANFEPTEIDFKLMTPAMLNRIINKPEEASGCIQCLLECVSARDALIKCLETNLEQSEAGSDLAHKLITEMLTFYIVTPWYKRVWNAIMCNREGTVKS